MKVSYRWLCEILPGLEKHDPREVASRLTLSGLEVESILDRRAGWPGIVVGEVVSLEKHPNADRLRVCQVRAGGEALQVVCGAPNVVAGGKYPFATLGTTMPDGLQIKQAKLRSVESNGMLCSARELQLSEESDGLLTLDATAIPGTPIAQALGLDDAVLEIGVTPNRGDALGHWGVAQDLAAIFDLSFDHNRRPKGFERTTPGAANAEALSVTVSVTDAVACPRYTATPIASVKVAPSPTWLARRLESLGVRSINNIVDATNLVMLLTGHPVHAFDAKFVNGGKITVGVLGKAGEFKTLDGVVRKLEADDVVIADANGPIALAGVMGGEHSGVNESTSDVILEVATFDPIRVRKTAKRLGLHSESSSRFERFVNADTVEIARLWLVDLVLNLAGGSEGDVVEAYAKAFARPQVFLPISEITRLLGVAIPTERVKKILTSLGCGVTAKADGLTVSIPAARVTDLTRPADVVEEIARLYGLDEIPETLPRLPVKGAQESAASRLRRDIKNILVARGCQETVHYSFGARDHFLKAFPDCADKLVALANPLSEDLAVMRPSLLPDLLASYRRNAPLAENGLRFFELRKVYEQKNDIVNEREILAIVIAGSALGRNPFGVNRSSDFFEGKGLVNELLAKGRISTEQGSCSDWPWHPGQCVRFTVDNVTLARVGTLHPEILTAYKIKDQLVYLELDYTELAARFGKTLPAYQSIPSLPPVYRDLALLVPTELKHAEILSALMAEKPEALKSVHLFDVYEGANLPAGKKSLAYSLVYASSDENLTDEQVNSWHFDLVERLKAKLPVELRS